MISADGAMYASKRAGKNRVTGVGDAAPAGGLGGLRPRRASPV